MFPFKLAFHSSVTLCLIYAQDLINQLHFHKESGVVGKSWLRNLSMKIKSDDISCSLMCIKHPHCSSFMHSHVNCILYKDAEISQMSGKYPSYYIWHVQERKKEWTQRKTCRKPEMIPHKEIPRGQYHAVCAGNEVMYLRLFRRLVDYETAKTMCLSNGGSLAGPKTDQEHQAVSLYLKHHTHRVLAKGGSWIGQKHERSANTYQWLDGTPVTSPRWLRGQPSNIRNGCVNLRNSDYEGYGWSIAKCNTRRIFICQAGSVKP